jgi:hypothetical protein
MRSRSAVQMRKSPSSYGGVEARRHGDGGYETLVSLLSGHGDGDSENDGKTGQEPIPSRKLVH